MAKSQYIILPNCKSIVSNCKIKRFIYACTAKLNNEQFDDVIDIDECTVELRYSTYKNWRKSTNKFLRAHNGKFGKPKHQTVKVHLFGGYFAQRIVAFSNIQRYHV